MPAVCSAASCIAPSVRSFMTSMSGTNENPPIAGAFSGLGSFHGFCALDNAGNYVTGGGLFVVN